MNIDSRAWRRWTSLLVLLAVTIATRAQTFGNPLLGFDEQFYLLVGDRMVHGGALPFVDIFDRKPIGLFLIFAAIRSLGGEGTIQYQLAAAAFALVTAMGVERLARRATSDNGALAAGVAYLVWMALLGGEGGQSPVFYNLPIVLAADATLRIVHAEKAPFTRAGGWPMLLVGLAMQIKYTAVFEGLFFGAALLWVARREGRRSAHSHPRLVVNALVWIAVALAPTLLALAVYGALGHGQAFVFANFVSQWGRYPDDLTTSVLGLARIVAILSPLLIAALLARGLKGRDLPLRFIQSWLAAAILGFLVMRSFPSPHYGLPLIAPAAVAGSRLWDSERARRGIAVVLLLALAGSQVQLASQRRARGGATVAARLATVARPVGGCLYVYDGPPALYRLTETCLPTKFVFPGHLDTANEASAEALGVDPVVEVRRIMASGPATVVVQYPYFERGNRATLVIVLRSVANDYHLTSEVAAGSRRWLVYHRLTRRGDFERRQRTQCTKANRGMIAAYRCDDA